MKKWIVILLSVLMVFVLAACGNTQNGSEQTTAGSMVESKEPETSTQQGTESPEENRSGNSESAEEKTLVVYFSMPETTNPDNMTQEED